jgi:hypothetical protein
MVLGMRVMNIYVSMCNANGYGKFGNCSTLKYFMLCHHLRRWLLTSSPHIQVRRLCIFIENNTMTMLDVIA